MSKDEKRVQYLKVFLMIVMITYVVWRVETIVNLLR